MTATPSSSFQGGTDRLGVADATPAAPQLPAPLKSMFPHRPPSRLNRKRFQRTRMTASKVPQASTQTSTGTSVSSTTLTKATNRSDRELGTTNEYSSNRSRSRWPSETAHSTWSDVNPPCRRVVTSFTRETSPKPKVAESLGSSPDVPVQPAVQSWRPQPPQDRSRKNCISGVRSESLAGMLCGPDDYRAC